MIIRTNISKFSCKQLELSLLNKNYNVMDRQLVLWIGRLVNVICEGFIYSDPKNDKLY